jgi:hypothetical protein
MERGELALHRRDGGRALRSRKASNMEHTGTMRIDNLKTRVGTADYQVDVQAVAEAMLDRPMARVWLLPRNPFAAGESKSGTLPTEVAESPA